MNADRMATNIRRIATILKKYKIIDDKSKRLLFEVASNVRTSRKDQWELTIHPGKPLEFAIAENDDRLKTDLFCNIMTINNETFPISYLRLVLRVWSIKQNLSFRSDWDSEKINQQLIKRGLFNRVVFRCHYDSTSKDQYAPIFHLQFGGTSHPGELCWFPKNLELPRFPSPPIDLILACELVVATFFPSIFKKLCQEGNWVNLIQESEKFFMKKYYKLCMEHFANQYEDKTLLDRLCVTIS